MGHDMHTQETTILTLVLIGTGVLGMILLYFIITMIRQHRKTQLLHHEKIQAEIRTLERERRRIANDLHDDLGPMLASVKFHATAAELKTEEDKILIQKVCDLIDEMLTRIREIAFDLMPNALTRKGLVATLEELIPKAEKLFPFKIEFVHDQSSLLLPPEMTIHLYRIILEIIHNTIKHSEATELTMKLLLTENEVIFESRDNGIGFDLKRIDEKMEGLGLKNLQTRTEIMHGELKIQTEPGKGVWYYLHIPLT
jgi:two-component system, NarL family, sensor kinase